MNTLTQSSQNIATWSIRNPIPAVLFFILATLAGIWGFRSLGIQDFPDLDAPTVIITLRQPGAAPAQLETEVAKKVEDKLATVRGLNHISTNISDGTVNITATFLIEHKLSDALTDVKDAVDSIRGDLPTDLEEPQISKITTGPGGAMLTYAVTHQGMDEEELSWLTDDRIARTMLAVKGVGQFSRVGGVQREVQVLVDPAKLNAFNVTALDVSRALRRVQQENSGGRGQVGGEEQGIRTIATVKTAGELEALPIVLADGRSLRLDQVAIVKDAIAERNQAATLDGAPALGFQIFRSKGYDELKIERGVLDAIATLEAQNPGLKFKLVGSTVEHTKEQFRGSMNMLYEGGLLTILVIWWFLRDWRATVIGAIALPLSILPTFAFMKWMGYSLNTITLLALAVVVGILVDDAIVEVENIDRHIKDKGQRTIRQAIEDAVNEIWLAVLATTAALVVVFLPTAFMSGIPGLVFKQFGWTVVISVIASLVVARIATPVLAVWLLRDQAPSAKQAQAQAHSKGDGFWMRWYLKVVKWCLQHRRITLLLTLLSFAGSVALVPLLQTGFIPAGDKGRVTVDVELSPGASLQKTLAAAEEARLAVMQVPAVAQVFITAGAAKRPDQTSGLSAGEVRRASLNILLKPRKERGSQTEVENAMRPLLAAVPGIRWSISGGGPGEKLQLILASNDIDALRAAAEAVERDMRALPFLSGVTSSASLERGEITVRPDAAKAAERGVSTQAIGETLRVATSGDFSQALSKLKLDNRQLDVRVRFPDDMRKDPSAFANLRVPGQGSLVPLATVADIQLESGPAQIGRYDRQRYFSISADLGGYSLGAALQAAKGLPAINALPSSVKVVEQGDAEVMRDLFGGFGLALLIGVICKLCVLVLLFRNWFQPVTILSVLPMCVGGAFVALLAFGGQLSLPVLIGIVMLFGIVTKNSILVVEYAILGMQRGLSEHDALVDACHKRAQPVVMTTVAMIAGMLPMSFGWGGDGSFRQPMAIAVIGGLISSTLLSLIVVPVISIYVSKFERGLVAVLRKLGLVSTLQYKA
jgi:multidrug efflux pump subunit AcrB